MQNAPDERNPNEVWYLHVGEIHWDEYEDVEACIAEALLHVREGKEIHIQTRQQWLDMPDRFEEGYAAATERYKR